MISLSTIISCLIALFIWEIVKSIPAVLKGIKFGRKTIGGE